MSPANLDSYLVVGAVLFVLGMAGFLTRRNLIIMFLSAELMLQGVAVNLVASIWSPSRNSAAIWAGRCWSCSS
jgi:NADH:ubiquinone oxidoreductase subunit K